MGAPTTFTHQSGFGNYASFGDSNGQYIFVNPYSSAGVYKYGTGYNGTTVGTSYDGILTSIANLTLDNIKFLSYYDIVIITPIYCVVNN